LIQEELHENAIITYLPILLPRQKKPIHQTWLRQNPTKINSFLQPNFSHLILHIFVTIPHQDCSKTNISLIHEFCYQGKKASPPNLA